MADETKPKENKTSTLKRLFKSPWPWILTLLACAIFFLLGDIIRLILPYTKYYYVPGFLADVAADKLRVDLAYPLSDFGNVNKGFKLLVIPYYLFWSYLLFFAHLKLKWLYKYVLGATLLVLLFLRIMPGTLRLFETSAESISVGKSTDGTIENARRMPFSKRGYSTYSFWGYLAGRTFVHEKVKDVVVESFKIASEKCDGRDFVLGETGLKDGGPIAFHKGKQNGMQVDVLLPFEKDGEPYTKCNIFNSWFYRSDIDKKEGFKELGVNYQHLKVHLLTLMQVAPKHGLVLRKVEVHNTIKTDFLNDNGKVLKKLLVFGGRKESTQKPAYYTLTFAEPGSKTKKGLKKILNRQGK